MIEIIGSNGLCKIMTDMRDETAISHLYRLMSSGITEGSTVRVMADYHEGKGAVIGYTQKLNENDLRICPNVVGVDIGCRVTSVCLPRIHDLDFEKIDKWIRTNVPLGAGGYLPNGLPNKLKNKISKEDLALFETANRLLEEDGKGGYRSKVSILNQLFSLGSGNHYIAINKDKEERYWLTIHCGSRNFGLVTANVYQRYAIEECEDRCEKEMRYLESKSKYFNHYLTCVNACQTFSKINHEFLIEEIGNFLCKEFSDIKSYLKGCFITTLHNYVDLNDMIIRKGAISAKKNELVLIPFNMRDGIAICRGKGNEDYNYSAPHGAGRIMSRSQAKKNLDLNKVKEDMKEHDVFTTSLDYALDEAADAYKDKDEIIKFIQPTVEVIEVMKEVYNIKGK